MVRLAMRSSPLLALLLFTVTVHTIVSAPPSSTVPNRTLPYPHPSRFPRLTETLMHELLRPDGGKRTLKSWNGKYLTELEYADHHILIPAKWLPIDGQYWYIEQINDNEVALKSKNGWYITHWWFGQGRTRTTIANEWEMLTPVKNADGSWSFKSRWNKWMSADPDKRIYFVAENKAYERWRLESWH